MRPRRTARVLLFDEEGRVLLIRCEVVRRDGNPFRFWLTPGGEIEAGEEPLCAARRELREELGIAPDVEGPVYTERNQFEHLREMVDNTDFYFVAHCSPSEPELRGVSSDEIAMMRETRWWTSEEVQAGANAGHQIFPVDLAPRMASLAQEGRVVTRAKLKKR